MIYYYSGTFALFIYKIDILYIYTTTLLQYIHSIQKIYKMRHELAIAEKKSNDNNEEWFDFWISWWGWLL